ncbi:MAG TPA: hypothetical protein VMT30_04380 [Candidatus Saccharimonadia bacterium]|nr:hypothetical protein [Candidatus Saccharimonadia bacterium]
MAEFDERENQNPTRYKKLGYQMKLKATELVVREFAKNADVIKALEILSASDACVKCRPISRAEISIHEAKGKRPVPVEDCLNP